MSRNPGNCFEHFISFENIDGRANQDMDVTSGKKDVNAASGQKDFGDTAAKAEEYSQENIFHTMPQKNQSIIEHLMSTFGYMFWIEWSGCKIFE